MMKAVARMHARVHAKILRCEHPPGAIESATASAESRHGGPGFVPKRPKRKLAPAEEPEEPMVGIDGVM
jgi:hypothetical protein